MIVYTLLFTLVGKDPADNRYIEMLYMWLTYVLRNAGLKCTDKVCILLDKASIDFINVEPLIGHILQESKICVEFLLIDRPETIKEGMVHRYDIEKYGKLISECSLYLDLDVLVIKPIDIVRGIQPDTMLLVTEGNAYNDDYGGKVLPYDSKKETYPGFTSAIFAFAIGEKVWNLLKSVKEDCLKQEPAFYTVDQPFFNKYVYEIFIDAALPIYILPPKLLINNDMRPNDLAVFVNFCGDPGNGPKHSVKMVMMLCMDVLTNSRRVSLLLQKQGQKQGQEQGQEQEQEQPGFPQEP